MSRSPVDIITARELGLPLPLSPNRIEAAQMRLLRLSVAHCQENSPFYHRWLASVQPQQLQTRRDLEQLPLLTPAQLQEAGESILGVSGSDIGRIVTLQTSGSTGQPKRIYYSHADLEATRRFFHHGMLSLIGPDTRVLALLPGQPENSVGALLCQALNTEGISCTTLWPPEAGKLLETIERERIGCLVGLPQHLLETAHLLRQRYATSSQTQATAQTPSPVRTMLLCSDYAPAVLRRRITRLCGAETFLHWGATETGLGGGVECAMHDGCHLRDSQLLVEIIDPASLRSLPDGQPGEIVVTTLQRRAMVLLRYRTGDFGVLSRERCGCGAGSSRLLDIRGREIACRIINGNKSDGNGNSALRNRHGNVAGHTRKSVTSRELDDQLFAIDGLLDYHAELGDDAAAENSSVLTIHYREAPESGPEQKIDETILRQLRYIPVLQRAEKRGELRLRAHRAAGSQRPDHTFKRSISDNRSRKESCVTSSTN